MNEFKNKMKDKTFWSAQAVNVLSMVREVVWSIFSASCMVFALDFLLFALLINEVGDNVEFGVNLVTIITLMFLIGGIVGSLIAIVVRLDLQLVTAKLWNSLVFYVSMFIMTFGITGKEDSVVHFANNIFVFGVMWLLLTCILHSIYRVIPESMKDITIETIVRKTSKLKHSGIVLSEIETINNDKYRYYGKGIDTKYVDNGEMHYDNNTVDTDDVETSETDDRDSVIILGCDAPESVTYPSNNPSDYDDWDKSKDESKDESKDDNSGEDKPDDVVFPSKDPRDYEDLWYGNKNNLKKD